MKREEFEHVVRTAAAIVDDEIVVIGSQALHGEILSPPDALIVSREVDVYPKSAPERADEIDVRIGDGSVFDSTFGYYAHGVGPETPKAPAGWENRLVRIDVPGRGVQRGTTAWCMSFHDLVLAKLAAGRAHDFEFAEAAIRHELVNLEQLNLGIELMEERDRKLVIDRLAIVLARI